MKKRNGREKMLMENTIEYLGIRIQEMTSDWDKLDKISNERELTKREEHVMIALAEEMEKYRHIQSTTLTELNIYFPEEPMSDEEAHSQVTLEMKNGKDIPLAVWARREGIAEATARQKALRGALKTVHKEGSIWMINELELNGDSRRR